MKGHKHTEEWKEKTRLFRLGKKHSIETKLKIGLGNKNKTISGETRKKMSEIMRGENHPNWKGGITPLRKKLYFSLEYKLWRKAVFERDNYTCIWCGIKGSEKGGYLQVDHIKPWALFPELRFAIDNGRTLCRDCHRTTETWGRNYINKIKP
jgi:hypothetical protein